MEGFLPMLRADFFPWWRFNMGTSIFMAFLRAFSSILLNLLSLSNFVLDFEAAAFLILGLKEHSSANSYSSSLIFRAMFYYFLLIELSSRV